MGAMGGMPGSMAMPGSAGAAGTGAGAGLGAGGFGGAATASTDSRPPAERYAA